MLNVWLLGIWVLLNRFPLTTFFEMVFFGSAQSKTEQEHIFAQAQQHIAIQVSWPTCFCMFFLADLCYQLIIFLYFWQKIALEAGGLNIAGLEGAALTRLNENATKVLCLTEVNLLCAVCWSCYPKSTRLKGLLFRFSFSVFEIWLLIVKFDWFNIMLCLPFL